MTERSWRDSLREAKDYIRAVRSRSDRRRNVIARSLGLAVTDLRAEFFSPIEIYERQHWMRRYERRRKIKDAFLVRQTALARREAARKKALKKLNDDPDLIEGGKLFMKGTQSSNPQNDYSLHYVNTGIRPQNMVRDTGLVNRFEEYPKLRELISLKDQRIEATNCSPMYLKADLMNFDLKSLGGPFDVILLEPPLEEYRRLDGCVYDRYWNWEEIGKLDIGSICSQRSFVWMWCGSGEGLDKGRECLRKWGFRRCEDICWIKTNHKAIAEGGERSRQLEAGAVFVRTKEHCLMGIHGTIKRSKDTDFIHSNVDIDIIIDEEPEPGVKDKPDEIFHIIEHFCLGRRRLHIFGRDSSIRPGWVTIGPELTSSNFDRETYLTSFKDGPLTGSSEEIDRLRPKSPAPKVLPLPAPPVMIPGGMVPPMGNYPNVTGFECLQGNYITSNPSGYEGQNMGAMIPPNTYNYNQ